MKRFLLRTLLFVSILVALLILLLVISRNRDLASLREQLTLRKGVSIVSLAHSHTQCAIDEETWPSYQNLSTISSELWWWLAKLELLIEYNEVIPKAVIIAVSATALEFAGDEALERERFFHQFTLAIPLYRYWPYREAAIVDPTSLLTFHNLFDKELFVHPIEELTPIPLKDPDLEQTDRQIEQAFSDVGSPAGRFQDSRLLYFSLLDRFCEVAADAGIVVVAISTPVHPRYASATPESCRRDRTELLDHLRAKAGVVVLDYWELYSEDWDFSDSNHLSTKGRVAFTRLLRQDLEGHGVHLDEIDGVGGISK